MEVEINFYNFYLHMWCMEVEVIEIYMVVVAMVETVVVVAVVNHNAVTY